MIRLIGLNIGLLKDHSDKIRSWAYLITKLKSDNIVTASTASTTSSSVAVKMPFKLHTPGTVSTYTDASYTSDQLRQKILRTSVIKSLGDYTQELNMVTKNSGYVDVPVTIPAFVDNSKTIPEVETSGEETRIRTPEDIRLGFSTDRPSGVRLLLLKLFGKEKTKDDPKSGTNPRSIVGYYDTLGQSFIAYNKLQFPPNTAAAAYKSDSEFETTAEYDNSKKDYKGGKKITRKSRKQIKGITKKRKKLLKNKKISKRNNKGTRTRKRK